MKTLLTIKSILPLTSEALNNLEKDWVELTALDFFPTEETKEGIIETLFDRYNDPWFFNKNEAINWSENKYLI